MFAPATAQFMKDGQRLHLQHGPSDLICEAVGEPDAVRAAYAAATAFFATVLEGIVLDLTTLKQPVSGLQNPVSSPVSQRMIKRASCFAKYRYVTPMAGVAGAIADAVLAEMAAIPGLQKAYVNNGGDIALYLAAGQTFSAAIIDNQDHPKWDGTAHVKSLDCVGGIATSGWKGRSFSFGIADAVTVLAADAVTADFAATLIAGDVTVECPQITRQAAKEMDPDSDLGDRLVTTDVGPLSRTEKFLALSAGAKTAKLFQSAGLINGAYLSLQGEVLQVSQQTRKIREKVA